MNLTNAYNMNMSSCLVKVFELILKLRANTMIVNVEEVHSIRDW